MYMCIRGIDIASVSTEMMNWNKMYQAQKMSSHVNVYLRGIDFNFVSSRHRTKKQKNKNKNKKKVTKIKDFLLDLSLII